MAVVCAALVSFSLMVSMVIPKRRPGFPGRRNLAVFTLVALAFIAGMLAVVEVYGAEGSEAEAAEHGGVHPGEPEKPPASPPDEEPHLGEAPEPAASPGDTGAGALLFDQSGCAACHVLADAGASGTIGPNLDESQSPFDLVVDRVTNGMGAMPSYAGRLSEQEIKDLAAYVVAATSG